MVSKTVILDFTARVHENLSCFLNSVGFNLVMLQRQRHRTDILHCPKELKIAFVFLQSKTSSLILNADHSIPDFIYF